MKLVSSNGRCGWHVTESTGGAEIQSFSLAWEFRFLTTTDLLWLMMGLCSNKLIVENINSNPFNTLTYITAQPVFFSHSVTSDSFATPWSVVRQAPLCMGFPGQEYWSGLPFPSPGDLPNPGTEPTFLALAGRFFSTGPPGKPSVTCHMQLNPD